MAGEGFRIRTGEPGKTQTPLSGLTTTSRPVNSSQLESTGHGAHAFERGTWAPAALEHLDTWNACCMSASLLIKRLTSHIGSGAGLQQFFSANRRLGL
ncbi:unnamed protein product [Cercospora beticola]|nr:unnamed protein product [Cercospora beticola]